MKVDVIRLVRRSGKVTMVGEMSATYDESANLAELQGLVDWLEREFVVDIAPSDGVKPLKITGVTVASSWPNVRPDPSDLVAVDLQLESGEILSVHMTYQERRRLLQMTDPMQRFAKAK